MFILKLILKIVCVYQVTHNHEGYVCDILVHTACMHAAVTLDVATSNMCNPLTYVPVLCFELDYNTYINYLCLTSFEILIWSSM